MNRDEIPNDIMADYLTKAQLAQALGVCERTLDNWADLRTGPPRTKVGKRTLYAKESVRRWLSEREETPIETRRRPGSGRLMTR